MDIFSANPGVVSTVSTSALPFTLQIGDDQPTDRPNSNWKPFPAFQSIITDIGVQQAGGYQFRHTMADFVYAYVFGERLGEMVVRGLAFSSDCKELTASMQWASAGVSVPTHHGLEWIQGYYLANRLSNRSRPITIVMGVDLKFKAFLTGFDFNMANREAAPHVAEFTLKFRIIPDSNVVSIDPGFQKPSVPTNNNNPGGNNPPDTNGGGGGGGELPPDVWPSNPSETELIHLFDLILNQTGPLSPSENVGLPTMISLREGTDSGGEVTYSLPDWSAAENQLASNSSTASKAMFDFFDEFIK